MSKELYIFNKLHNGTKRDYFYRMQDEKAFCMSIAKKYDEQYWDGDRRFGYGGYRYDGRWKIVAEDLISVYNLQDGCKILDVGCGKAYLLYELKQLLPNAVVVGFDSSIYALSNAKDEMKPYIFEHDASQPFNFSDNEFDLVISLTTLHNLKIFELKNAIQEMQRVAKKSYILVESYRNDLELFNLQCWALTCESFFSPQEWLWLFDEWGYIGDYEFIYFE